MFWTEVDLMTKTQNVRTAIAIRNHFKVPHTIPDGGSVEGAARDFSVAAAGMGWGPL